LPRKKFAHASLLETMYAVIPEIIKPPHIQVYTFWKNSLTWEGSAVLITSTLSID